MDRFEIFQTRSIPIFLCHRQEAPSTVRVKIQRTGATERTYIYVTLWRLEIWHDSSKVKTFCLLRDIARDFSYHTYLFKRSQVFQASG